MLIAYVRSALSILFEPIATPSDETLDKLLIVIESINSFVAKSLTTSPLPSINSTSDNLPCVMVPVLSLNKIFRNAESENASL